MRIVILTILLYVKATAEIDSPNTQEPRTSHLRFRPEGAVATRVKMTFVRASVADDPMNLSDLEVKICPKAGTHLSSILANASARFEWSVEEIG